MDRDQTLRAFGEKLKRLRKEKGLTHLELAGMIFVDPQHLSKLERGKHEPGIITVILLAQALNCSPGDLLNEL